MVLSDDALTLLRSSIRSVWALELLLLLRRHPDRDWSNGDLVRELRGSDVMVQQGNVQIAAGVVEGKTNNNYATYNLKLNDGVSMKSSVTNKGNKISCSVNALGFIVRYKTPVVQVTTQVQSANDTININSVVDVGEASESALAGIFCKNGTFEVQWDN